MPNDRIAEAGTASTFSGHAELLGETSVAPHEGVRTTFATESTGRTRLHSLRRSAHQHTYNPYSPLPQLLPTHGDGTDKTLRRLDEQSQMPQ